MTSTGTPLDTFRAAVMTDPAIQQTLAEQLDTSEFVRIALDYATNRKIALTAEALLPLLVPDPIGARAIFDPPLQGDVWPPRPWLPVAVALHGQPGVDWCHSAGAPLGQPFYHEVIGRMRERPFNLVFRYRTPIEQFSTAEQEGALAPSGLIFHMSRCGSTLVSQMLTAAPRTTVMSEPSPLDMIAQLPFFFGQIDQAWHVDTFRAMAGALGRDRQGDTRHYFIKTDCWHMMALPLYQAAFPGVPWVFLYRDPVEVLVSHDREPGPQTSHGGLPPHLFGFDEAAPPPPPLDYAAQALARTCEAAIANLDRGGLLINYRELPDAVFTRILPHFGIDPDEATRAAMTAATARNSKNGGNFTPDSKAKRNSARDEIRAVATRHLADVYAEMEEINASSRR